MATDRHLTAVPDRDNAETPGGVATAEALALFLRHLAGRRGRSGRITDRRTLQRYLKPSKEGTHQRPAGDLAPNADELAARMTSNRDST
ncbi:hypothetical protein [Nonomuraea dietziae]|uniref:hypothetical protein n=1 Tax=Nonomuraea dietziae TaxID=65515 RepID=UPI0033DD21A6